MVTVTFSISVDQIWLDLRIVFKLNILTGYLGAQFSKLVLFYGQERNYKNSRFYDKFFI